MKARLSIFQTLALGKGDQRPWFTADEFEALGLINGLPDALTRLRKCGGRCVLELQSIAQASTNYGKGPAQYAWRLIGEREVVRFARSRSGPSGPTFGRGHDINGHSAQTATELAVMAAEIEQLPDRTGFLKFALQAGRMRVGFPVYKIEKSASAFVPS